MLNGKSGYRTTTMPVDETADQLVCSNSLRCGLSAALITMVQLSEPDNILQAVTLRLARPSVRRSAYFNKLYTASRRCYVDVISFAEHHR